MKFDYILKALQKETEESVGSYLLLFIVLESLISEKVNKANNLFELLRRPFQCI